MVFLVKKRKKEKRKDEQKYKKRSGKVKGFGKATLFPAHSDPDR